MRICLQEHSWPLAPTLEVHGEDFFLKDDLPEVVMFAHTPASTKFYGTALPRVILLERAHGL
jgi:hypothetical protein